jgi:hypothetical protein
MSGEEGEEYQFASFETTSGQHFKKPADNELKMPPGQGVEFRYRSQVEHVRIRTGRWAVLEDAVANPADPRRLSHTLSWTVAGFASFGQLDALRRASEAFAPRHVYTD